MLMLVLENAAQMKIVKFFHHISKSPASVMLSVSYSVTVVMISRKLVVIMKVVRFFSIYIAIY